MARQTKALVQEAEALGIDVDGRWGDETIQERIDARRNAFESMDAANAGAGLAPDGITPLKQETPNDPDAQAKAAVAALEAEAGADATVSDQLAGAASGSASDATEEVRTVLDTPSSDQPLAGNADEDGGAVLGLTEGDDGQADGAEAGPDAAIGGEGEGEAPSQEPGATGPGEMDKGGQAPEQNALAGDVAGGGAGVDGGDGSAADGADGGLEEPGEEDVEDALDEPFERRRDADQQAAFEMALGAAVGPMAAALHAASTAFYAIGNHGATAVPGMDFLWFVPSRADVGDWLPPLVSILVPFVRSNLDAPAEAMFITMRDQAPELGHAGNWSDLPATNRTAWEIFRTVLLLVDRLLAAERAAEDAGTAERRTYPADPDDMTLEPVDDTFALTEVAKAAARREAAAS